MRPVKTVEIETTILSRILAKIRLYEDKCKACNSGRCVVCKAYKKLYKADPEEVRKISFDKNFYRERYGME